MEVEIRRYQKELQIPFLYVTHNQEEALTMSDRIAVMRNGVFDQVAPRMEVYSKPATAFVACLRRPVEPASRAFCAEFEGDCARLDWKGIELIVPKPEQCRAGDRVLFSIKYEDVEIVAARPADGEPARHPSRRHACATSSSRARRRTTSSAFERRRDRRKRHAARAVRCSRVRAVTVRCGRAGPAPASRRSWDEP